MSADLDRTKTVVPIALVVLGLLTIGATAQPIVDKPLEGTYWKATELAEKPVAAPAANREAHLVFQPGGRLSGSDGCNRITGSYQLKGNAVTFGQMAGTRMACIDAAAETELAFRDTLKSATRLTRAGDRLTLSDESKKVFGVFTATAQPVVASNAPALTGTSWQLVKFQGGDGKMLTPDRSAIYRIEFSSGGQLMRALTATGDGGRGSRAVRINFSSVHWR